MVKEFEVEYRREKATLAFFDPTCEEQEKWMEYAASMNKFSDELAASKDTEKLLELAKGMLKRKREIIFSLYKGDKLKTSEDMRGISTSDMKKIFDWFDSAIGIAESREKKDF